MTICLASLTIHVFPRWTLGSCVILLTLCWELLVWYDCTWSLLCGGNNWVHFSGDCVVWFTGPFNQSSYLTYLYSHPEPSLSIWDVHHYIEQLVSPATCVYHQPLHTCLRANTSEAPSLHLCVCLVGKAPQLARSPYTTPTPLSYEVMGIFEKTSPID